MIYVLEREIVVAADLETVWAYFSTPRNLNEMTPAELRFEFVSGGEEPMYAGQMIEYKITLLPGWRVRWLTEISHVQEKAYFVDEQRLGPYRLWIHEHRFERLAEGTRVRDRVTYALPFGPLGDLVHALFVRKRLKAIFDFRSRHIQALFGQVSRQPLLAQTD